MKSGSDALDASVDACVSDASGCIGEQGKQTTCSSPFVFVAIAVNITRLMMFGISTVCLMSLTCQHDDSDNYEGDLTHQLSVQV